MPIRLESIQTKRAHDAWGLPTDDPAKLGIYLQ